LQEKDFPGHLFNVYNWGGYLIWNYPERKVFIDGRCLDEETFFNYKLISNAIGGRVGKSKEDRKPLWKELLDEYEVGVVLTNAVTSTGKLVPLVDQLSFDPEWALVYQDGTALVYIRDTPLNRQRYGLIYLPKKEGVYNEIVSESQRGLAKHPSTWGYYELLGFVYMNRRDLAGARKMYEKYLSMNPNQPEVIEKLNMIRGFYGEAPLPVPEKYKSPHAW
jgi:tetratricopeptide (TPR) repeat protein